MIYWLEAFKRLERLLEPHFSCGLSLIWTCEKPFSERRTKVSSTIIFRSGCFFANGGVIRTNDPLGQEKIVQIHHLLNDLVVLFNTHHMTKALNTLRAEGFQINEEDLAHISPYAQYGINLIGGYQVDLKRKLDPLALELST